ncbi:hypothetical protein ACFOWX_08705 [Sphingorhabdus arenilitoris]|uniref:Uncharacterized protein n=1 Tax=Sphingorhabdus arenilitoris TaxID=1490041 RepID=A0ABV8RHQ0_9SPHN
MNYALKLLLTVSPVFLLSGCAAALIPIASTAVIGHKVFDRPALQSARYSPATSQTDIVTATTGRSAVKGTEDPNELGASIFGNRADTKNGVKIVSMPKSKELGEILSRYPVTSKSNQFQKLLDYGLSSANSYIEGGQIKSAMLKPNYSTGRPKFADCAGRPLAVTVDIDANTAALNGSTSLLDASPATLNDLAVTLLPLRESGITVIWESNRPTEDIDEIIRRLVELKINDERDYLSLDRGTNDSKQLRKATISDNYCIFAMLGDHRSDFDELFNYLRDPQSFTELDFMLGSGWFLFDLNQK